MSNPERDLLDRAAALIVAKKGARLTVVDVGGSSIPTSYFLIASGENPLHVKALCNELLSKLPLAPRHTEGVQEGRWALLDYGDFIVHVFHDEVRAFYDIEGLWPERQVVPWPGLRASPPSV
ncbi:MAG TPA: ribosome silencing factor [Candidatus Bipolaricaulis anaerobius]|jgi:ribosome-associated protein|uniref:Ribosomal silencing factor RsfS n=1 Tax=Candidatus Bipolaricaulis anaerobius TaxID=2026885 RepID=A0A2X3L116_9BACT|nr:ribosome silencing factor [Candidatus Bipolaricaulis anaerobius]MBP7726850.1 ribosome silencing factor [Candidatus Bipolaricaulis sp.]MDD5764489.1 ribosome silencing factor [Candidatus Bipolaricaulis anaerobius]SQD92470.1 Ribosomal silencing factor RsfS [Candidatus Bipolaricaulis anaerobius]HNR24781.1 ribosome silencing factor [Candidatus Bipolaricaulis anaerobius]HNS24134.1 ribosome silencing factor [Candidatus Bipolaricaulis anaerobius]